MRPRAQPKARLRSNIPSHLHPPRISARLIESSDSTTANSPVGWRSHEGAQASRKTQNAQVSKLHAACEPDLLAPFEDKCCLQHRLGRSEEHTSELQSRQYLV